MFKSIMQFFTEYAKGISIRTMIGHSIIFIMLISWLGFVTLITLNFPIISEMYFRYQDSNNIKIERAMTASSRVHTLITNQRLRMGADRLYVSKFHNGKRDLNQVHFIFFSRVAESSGNGISNEITKTQNLPLSVFPGMVTALTTGKCYFADIANTTVENASFFSEMGVQNTIVCPIYNLNGSLIGIVGVEDVISSNIHTNTKTIQLTLNTLAGVLGDILSME
jgi:hypothetical protein